MPRSGQEIDAIRLHVDWQMSGGLCDVHDKGNPMALRDLSDFANGLNRAGHIAGMGNGDEPGVGANGAGDVIGINQSGCRVNGHSRLLDQAGVHKSVQRAKDGIVIDLGADGVTLAIGIDESLDGQVQRVGAIEGEDKMLASLAVEKSAQAPAAFAEQFPGFDGLAISPASGTGADLRGVADHGFGHLRGLGEAGRGVIHVKPARRRGGFCFSGHNSES